MNKQILFVGLDVDDKAFHCFAISQDQKFTGQFSSKPSIGALFLKLNKFVELGYELKVCYEATFLGFSLQRALSKKGVFCEVIAPSLIPRTPGAQVKTDRLDSMKLAEFYKNGLLTVVHVPNEEEEMIRDLIRSRKNLSEQQKKIKNSINSLCRRLGRNYKQEIAKPTASYWTLEHWAWLEDIAKNSPYSALKFNLTMLLLSISQSRKVIESYDSEIKILSETPRYQKQVQALNCYRGVDTLTSMGVIVELGDISRFAHPKSLASYAGMDLREYSSGGKEFKYSMTKAGNAHLRTYAIESSQQTFLTPRIGPKLKRRRVGVDPKFIEIADRCMVRLHKKSTRLLFRGKARNKVKVACGRELLCFIWESLKEVKKMAS
jgi:transposase